MKLQNLAGQTLGQYELKEMLGRGGMGMVYRAYQPALERFVAVKVMASTLSEEDGYAERFNREAKTSAALEHPHIVGVHDYGIEGDISYVVMRLLSGGTLEQRLRRGESLTLPEIAKMLKQMAGALDYAHSKGVLHRDIKPSNIMFDERDDAYLVDFGIAKLLQGAQTLTGNATLLGTPSYMSPEQWLNQPLTGASDQYAMAVLIYRLLTGELPFDATTPYAVMNKHLNEFPTPPQAIRENIPLSVSVVAQRALSKVVDDRYDNLIAFSDAFDDAVHNPDGVSITAQPMRPLAARTSVVSLPLDQFISHVAAPQKINRLPLTGVALLISVLALVVIVLMLLIRLTEPVRNQRPEPVTADQFYERGLEDILRHNYGNAIEAFTRAVELQPDHVNAIYKRGYSYYYNDLFANALVDLNRVVRLDPTYTEAYVTRGDVYYYLFEYDNSLNSYRAALNLNQTHTAALVGMGGVLMIEECREDWLDYYQLYIELMGSDAERYVEDCMSELE